MLKRFYFVVFMVLLLEMLLIPYLGGLTVIKSYVALGDYVTVSVNPNNAGKIGEYYIKNITTVDKIDSLVVKLKKDATYKSENLQADSILVNNSVPLKVKVSSDDYYGVILYIWLNSEIEKNEGLNILIKKEAGIVNPVSPGVCYKAYIQGIYKNHEVFGIQSQQYTIRISSTEKGKVTVEPPVRGNDARYVIEFKTGILGMLNNGENPDLISVFFPSGTYIPNISKSSLRYVRINGLPVSEGSITKDGNKLEFKVNSYYPPEANIVIDISQEFGIKNPMSSGLKTVKISTTAEPDWVESEPYEIFEPVVKNLNINLSTSTVGLNSTITISFLTSPSGHLSTNSKIYVEFPNDFYVPSDLSSRSILVNGVAAVSTVTSNVIGVVTPAEILPLSPVEVKILDSAGIKNPVKPGNYVVNVWTDSDAFKTSFTAGITQSFLTNVKLEAQYSGANSVNAFSISFGISPVYTLNKDNDKILINFEEGFSLPETVKQDSVTVNGTAANNVTKDVYTLYITSPVDISPGSSVEVKISEDLGIKNPANPGLYGVKVSTTKEQTEVESNKIVITLLPQVNFDINPAVPNGLNGFYKTNPEVKLFTVNGTKVFYKIDDGEFAEYTNPFKIPEGTHTVYAYAVDSGNNKGDIIKKEFLVDSTPPTIKFDNASSNPVFKGSPGVLSGIVSEPCTLKINDSVLELKDDLNFTVELPNVYEGMPITVYMVDLAGNQNSLVLTAHIDNIPPVINFLDDGIKYQSGLYSVETTDSYYTIRVQLNEKGKLFVNSKEIVSKDNNNFESIVNLVDGDNRFDVRAVDVAGNETTRTLIVRKVNEKKIVLTVGSTLAIVGNEQITLEAAPVIEQGVTLVPLRFIAEAFDSEVNWNGALQIITIVNKTHNIQLQVNSKLVFIDNQKGKDLDVAPKIINGRTFVPIRFISEAFGATVDWDNNTKTVTITYKP